MNKCTLCPNECNVIRSENKGACGVFDTLRIAKYYSHPFEEPFISGEKGSGTIFFCGCSLNCPFCQNYEVSRNLRGKDITVKELADIFKELESTGVHNINLVSPTHYSDKIIQALEIYKPNIPVVYNTHGYEKIEILQKLLPFVDIFLPDMKFCSSSVSMRYVKKTDYFDVAKRAIEFMIKNKPVKIENDLMKSGVIVRHLVLPLCTSDSKKIIDWFSEFKDEAYFNLMSQYTPFGKIEDFPELKRKITKREYDSVLDYAISKNLKNMFYQKFESQSETYIPKWDY